MVERMDYQNKIIKLKEESQKVNNTMKVEGRKLQVLTKNVKPIKKRIHRLKYPELYAEQDDKKKKHDDKEN